MKPEKRSGFAVVAVAVHGLDESAGRHQHQEKGAAVADERQRQAGHRREADAHADVDEAVGEDDCRNADAEIAPERVVGQERGPQDRIEQQQVGEENQRAADEAGLFCDDREDEVVVGRHLGQEAEGVLGPFADAFPGESARGDRQVGLPRLVAGAGEKVLRMQEREDAVQLVAFQERPYLQHLVGDDEAESDGRGDGDENDVPPLEPRAEHDGQINRQQDQGAAEVGLFQNQHKRNRDGDAGEQQAEEFVHREHRG